MIFVGFVTNSPEPAMFMSLNRKFQPLVNRNARTRATLLALVLTVHAVLDAAPLFLAVGDLGW